MCGIAGVLSTRACRVSDVARMTDLIRHRGPDDEGFVAFHANSTRVDTFGGPDTPQEVFKSATQYAPTFNLRDSDDVAGVMVMGHRRLAIVDLSPRGHQPMSTPDGRYWIVYNGEVYNYLELRKELEALGVVFHSGTDTEVVLASYAQWGPDCLHRFNGMWAFTIVDTVTKAVFLARDRFGVKPLYWWRNGSTFLFASEIKSFLGHSEFIAAPNLQYLSRYLKVGAQEFTEETAFENVFRLRNGHYILSNADDLIAGRHQARQWWKLEPTLDTPVYSEAKADEIAREYAVLLASAVKLRLRADVRIGSALSGGLDSSSIVYLVNQMLREANSGEQQETFSSVYRSPGTEYCDESGFIEAVATQLGVHSNTIEPIEREIPHEYRRMIWAMDTPPVSTLMSSWHTFRLVHQRGIKVTLDGQGADEQLAGYGSYLANWLFDAPLLESMRRSRAVLQVHPRDIAVKSAARALAVRLLPRRLIGKTLGRSTLVSRLQSGLNLTLANDSLSTLITLLHYSDRTTMAYSVESRMPFLDYRLAEFLASVPSSYKIYKGWTKMPARLAFDGKLPDSVVWRKDKQGWPVPEDHWFRGGLRPWFESQERAGRQTCNELGLGTLPSAEAGIVERIGIINLHTWADLFLRNGSRPNLGES